MGLAINVQQATRNLSKGGGGGSGLALIVIAIVAIIAIYLWRSGWLGKIAPAAEEEPTTPPPATETPTDTETPTTGEFPYEPTGSANELEDQGEGTRHYASGKADTPTHEWEGKTNAQSYMIVIDITLTETGGDDTIAFKYGGTHNGSGWYDNTYGFESGQACIGKEEDHPNTDACEVTGTSIGNLVNNRVMLAGININKGEKLEMWSKFPDGQWQKDVESSNGVTGFRPSEDEDEIQIRIDDATGIDMHSAAWYEIQGTGTSTGGGEITDEPETDSDEEAGEEDESNSDEEEDEDGGAGAAIGYNPTLCSSLYNGSCNSECAAGANTTLCRACKNVCGLTTSNIARKVYLARRPTFKLRKSMSSVFFRAYDASATEKEDSDVDWDWSSPKLQYSSRRKISLSGIR